MSLRDKFKTSRELSSGGVWFDIKQAKNKDGSIPGFKLARLSMANPAYAKIIQETSEKIGEQTLTEEQDELMGLEILVNGALLDWRNVQLNDDGVGLPFSKESAMTLFADPEWIDLKIELRSQAAKITNFQNKKMDETAKN